MDKNALTLYYQNCRGLRSKLHTLFMNILLHSYDIIILTETWLTSDIFDNELIDSRYVLFRCDRDREATGRRDGGGVLVAVLRSIATSARARIVTPPPPPPPATTSLPAAIIDYVTIQLDFGLKLYTFSAVYIPPNQKDNIYFTYFSYLQNVFECATDTSNFIIGDFNMPSLDWCNKDKYMQPIPVSSTSRTANLMNDFLLLTNSFQFNHIRNKSKKILDLFISNILNCELLPAPISLVPIDEFHPTFYVMVPVENSYRHMQRKSNMKFCFAKADYQLINSQISNVDWEMLFKDKSSELAVNAFYDTIYGIISKNIPTKVVTSASFPVWYNSALRHIFKDKNKAWIKWKKFKNLSDYENFSMFRDRLKIKSESCYKYYINKVESSIKSNVKYFWTYISNRKKKSDIPSCVHYRKQMASDSVAVCNLYSNYFQSVFEASLVTDDYDINNIQVLDNPESDLIISDIQFTVKNVHTELCNLDPTKGVGADNIPPYFLNRTAESVCLPIHHIFNLCLREGVCPHIFKMARIVPVHKGGSRKDVENYRPISILSALSKLFERLIHNTVYPSLHSNIIPQQHGFVRRRSTITNLLVYTTEIFESLDKNKQMDSVYTDFRKAFDRVDHKILLDKIAFNGIRGNLWRWFKSYITNRTQKVAIQGYESDVLPVSSGVPQGSILGPLLFILYINDINKCFKTCRFLLYADDLKIFNVINTYQDHVDFQADLDRFSGYCTENKLALSLIKCKSIAFTRKRNISNFTYTLCNTDLDKVKVIKDLGITLDSKLTLDIHIQNIIARGFKMYNFVIRSSCNFKNEKTYQLLYNSLIRSQLEYAVSVWSPLYKCYNDDIERVQKKFLRCVHFKCYRSIVSYEVLLKKYKLLSLKSRRQQLDVMLLFDLCHNRYDCPDLIGKLRLKVPYRSLSRESKKQKTFALVACRTNSGHRSPLYRMTKTFNDNFSCLDIFNDRVGYFKRTVMDLRGGLISCSDF